MKDKSPRPLSNEEWEAFISRHDLTWSSMGEEWEQGAFLGNGMLGAMIYKDAPNILRWEMGRCDVVERFQIPRVDWAPPRLLIGDFLLTTVGDVQSEQMRLDLWNAEATGTIITDCGSIRWRSLVHTNDDILLIELETEGDEKDASLTFRVQNGISPCLHYNRIRQNVDSDWLARHTPPPPELLKRDGHEFISQDYISGGQHAVGWKEENENGTRRLHATVTSTYPLRTAVEEAETRIDHAINAKLDPWIDAHRTWWNEYYPKSFLTIDDPYWESFYWIQMYKLGAATREHSPVIDSQGPWMPQTPWPTCVWNLNVQTSYSPLFTSNRFEIGESLYSKLDNSMDELIMNVPDSFRSDAAGIGRSSSCISLRANTSPGWETGNLTWVCFNYYRHWRCSMDEGMLRNRLYPLLRRAINYYFHLVEEQEDGKLHLLKSVSPEYGPDKYTRDCNYDLALFQWGCRTLLKITEHLQIEDERKADWQDVIERLTDAPTDEFGLRIGRDVGFRNSHRHFSHLFSIWPLRLRNIDHPEFKEENERSINHWLGLDKELQGYTWTASSCMASGIGDGDTALKRLNNLRPYLQPNTMYTENGPVIETPLSAAESIHDMILQSWTDPLADHIKSVIRVFPAVPSDWKNITFQDLRAEGGFLVGASRIDRQTQWIKIMSLAGEPCLIQSDLLGIPQSTAPIEQVCEDCWSISIKAGESALLWPEETNPDIIIRPVDRAREHMNLFGMASNEMMIHTGKMARDPKDGDHE